MSSDLARLRQLRSERAWQQPLEVRPGSTVDDPRPDLEADSASWTRLLVLAAGDSDDPHGVFGRLLAMRACGGQLAWDGAHWRLEPLIDTDERLSAWHNRESWDTDRTRCLLPRAREIAALLAQLPQQRQA